MYCSIICLSDPGCPGFYTDTTQSNNCYICHVSNITEVQTSMHKSFGNNDKLYLLKSKPVTPDVSMSFDSHTGNIVDGIGEIYFNLNLLKISLSWKHLLKWYLSVYLVHLGIVGTTANVVDSDYVDGVLNSGLYLHDGGKVALTGSETSCWTKLQHCTSGMTVSLWVKFVSILQGIIFRGKLFPISRRL